MKVAYVMPHSYESLFPEEMRRFRFAGELDRSILARNDECENRYCKASLMAGIEPILYYFSPLTRKTVEFTHQDGYKMRKVPLQLWQGRYGRFGLEYSLSLLRELSRGQFDIVLVFSYYLNPLFWIDMYDIIAFHSRINRYPLIARNGGGSARNFILGNHSLPGRVYTKKVALNIAARIIVPSPAEYSILRDDLEIKEDKLLRLHDPIALDRFRPISRERVCHQLRKDPDKRYMLFVGRLIRAKGIQHAIRIFPKLKKIYPNLVFLVVGHGDFKKEMLRLVKELGLTNDIRFEGMVFHDSLPLYYNLADVLVAPSYDEGVPNVLQEAVACNLSCVSTNVGGVPSVLGEGVGIIVPPRNDEALLRATKTVLDGNFKIDQNKRRDLLDMWDIGNFGLRLKQLYGEIESTWNWTSERA